MDPTIAHFKQGGVSVDYRPQPDAAHNTRWWPEVRDGFEAFVREHPRQPLPATLTWEAGSPTEFNRAHWLVITSLWHARGEAASLPDLNEMTDPPAPDFGVRSIGVRINRVIPASSAERIGLKAGDAVVRLNGDSVRVREDLDEVFEELTPGSDITILVARNNAPVELTGRYEPKMVTRPPREVFDRTAVGPRRCHAQRQHGHRLTRGVGGFTLLISPDQFDFKSRSKSSRTGRPSSIGKSRRIWGR